MKLKHAKLINIVLATLLAACLALPASAGAPPQSAAPLQPAASPLFPSNPDYPDALSRELHVEGNKFYNDLGEEVKLHGVNICSMEWSGGENMIEKTVETLSNWNCNLLRIPLSQDRWFGRASDQNDGGSAYRQLLDEIIDLAAKAGRYVELDLHWSGAGVWGTATKQYKMPDMDSVGFWKDLAGRYKNHPAVLFDLFNEPFNVTWDVWKNGGAVDDSGYLFQSPGHQAIVDEIRAIGANNVIVVGGLDWAYDMRGIAPGYNGLANGYALADTIAGNGIAYETHIYTWKAESTWNNDNVGMSNYVLCLRDHYPIILGEFGVTSGEANTTPAWLPNILDWADRHELNWTAWCFHSAASPAMLISGLTPNAHFGLVIKERLLSYPETPTHFPETGDSIISFTAYNRLVAAVGALDSEDYTSASWALFQDAIALCDLTYDPDTPGIDALVLREMVNKIQAALGLLVAYDFTEYLALVAGVASLIEAEHSADSWGAFLTAIALCDLTLFDNRAGISQANIDSASSQITAALALLDKLDFYLYGLAAARMGGLDKSAYDAASWAAYEVAASLCDLTFDRYTSGINQAMINAETDKLQAAMRLLVKVKYDSEADYIVNTLWPTHYYDFRETGAYNVDDYPLGGGDLAAHSASFLNLVSGKYDAPLRNGVRVVGGLGGQGPIAAASYMTVSPFAGGKRPTVTALKLDNPANAAATSGPGTRHVEIMSNALPPEIANIGKISVSVWVKTETKTGGQANGQRVFGFGKNNDYTMAMSADFENNASSRRAIMAMIKGGSGSNAERPYYTVDGTAAGAAAAVAGTWYHLVYVYDQTLSPNSAKLTLYVNGAPFNNGSGNNATLNAILNATDASGMQYHIGVGQSNGGAGNNTDYTSPFNGEMTDFAVFDYALSPEQVAQLYNTGLYGLPDELDSGYHSVGFRAYGGAANEVVYTQWVKDGDSIDWDEVRANYPFYGGYTWDDIEAWINEADGEPFGDGGGDGSGGMPITGDIELAPRMYPLNTALVSISGPATAVSGPGAEVSYTISAKRMPQVSGIELEFEVDGSFLSSKDFSADSAFTFFGEGSYGTPIYWKNTGDVWTGKVTLLDMTAVGISGEAELFTMVFNVKEGVLGAADVKLNYIVMSYGNGEQVAAEIVGGGVATTVFEQYYSIYDVNKDGVIDLNDITYALQFLLVQDGDPGWEEAKAVNVNGDDIIDTKDLILILANYTIPYYQ